MNKFDKVILPSDIIIKHQAFGSNVNLKLVEFYGPLKFSGFPFGGSYLLNQIVIKGNCNEIFQISFVDLFRDSSLSEKNWDDYGCMIPVSLSDTIQAEEGKETVEGYGAGSVILLLLAGIAIAAISAAILYYCVIYRKNSGADVQQSGIFEVLV